MSKLSAKDSKRYPELQHFASADEASQILSAWQKQLMTMPRFWLTLLGYTVVVGLAATLMLIVLRVYFRLSSGVFGGLVGGVTGGTGAIALNWLWRHRCRRFLRSELIARGVPICLPCGYDLRGQNDPRCPECGATFDPDLIKSKDP